MSELLIIFGLALLVVGPKKLPEVARALGKAFWEIKNLTNNIKDEMNIDTLLEDEDDVNHEKKRPENSLNAKDSDLTSSEKQVENDI
jgi:TatA/E family protein of Tat protein translocase